MVTTDLPAEMRDTRHSFPRTALSIVVGVVVGALTYYVTAVVMSAQIPGGFTVNPLTLVAIAVVGALVVFIGWRWPTVGLAAGVLILVLVAFAAAGRMAWSSSSADWLNPFNAVAFGAASGYPALVGAVMVAVSALKLQSRRHSS